MTAAHHTPHARSAAAPAPSYSGVFRLRRNVSWIDARADYPWGRDGHYCGENIDAPDLVPCGSHKPLQRLQSVVACGYHYRSGE